MKRRFEITATYTADDEWSLPRDNEIHEAIQIALAEAADISRTKLSDVNVESDDIEDGDG